MIFGQYPGLKEQSFYLNGYNLRPIRYGDRNAILKWRNDQLYHLRQPKKLKEQEQDYYFKTVVASLFEVNYPDQLLFSLDHDNEHIAYGGLVHIDWDKAYAELSFVMNTSLETKYFKKLWEVFLILIEKIAKELNLKVIYTAAFDLRPRLYEVLELNGYKREQEINIYTKFTSQEETIIVHAKKLSYDRIKNSRY